MTNKYIEQGELAQDGDGSVAGDGAVTDSWSRRFVRDNKDGTFSMLTIYVVGVADLDGYGDPRTAPPIYDVLSIDEALECTDPENPGGTEITSDYQYSHPFDVAFGDPEEALEQGKRWLAALSLDWLG